MFDPPRGTSQILRISLLAVIAVCFLNAGVVACTCSSSPSVPRNFESSSLVFTGKVIRTDFLTLAETMNPDSLAIAQQITSKSSKNFLNTPMVLKATIVVVDDFKGTMKNDTIVVYTGIRGATCGFKFEQNKEYVVYASTENYMAMFVQGDRERFKKLGQRGTYWTNICTRTTISVGSEQLALREHTKTK